MTIIGEHYHITTTLGAGGMGTVFLADDHRTGQKVALKRLNPDILLQDASLLERFRREAEILRRLNHPGIVRVFDTFEHERHHYIVMEYIAGGSLRQMLDKDRRLPLNWALLLALDLADALTRAHRLEIVHRDLKPANVLIADDSTPRLTDFGVARMGNRERVTDTGAIIGTLDYLSPEALNGGNVDARTDVWSFGVMLYEMLTGERPFKGDSVAQTITAILMQPIPRIETVLPDCPIALVDLIERMLAKDPLLRLPGMRLAGAELEALLRSEAPATPTKQTHQAAAVVPETGRFDTPTPDSGGIPHNLPAQMASFIGREHELTELKTLLANPANRLITMTAPGGMGKTSLALEIGRHIVEGQTGWQTKSYRHGIFVTLLAPLSAVEHIVPAIAGAIGLQFGAGSSPQEQLLDYLREKHMLLVLDNFEHLMAGANIITEILRAAPGVKMLVTSRERLNLSTETVVHLGGMEFPEWETPEDALRYSAVKLFMQSARRVRLDFELKADDLKYVARICRITGGMPLGIVLAAAWVEMLSPAEIADEISKSLDFLESDLRDVPERQRSMRATFEYSWALLDDDTRRVFQQLSIFRGGFTREAVQAVTGIGLRELTALVNKSLLQRNVQTGRFEVHELLRQFAEDRLAKSGETEITHRAHAAYFAEFLSLRWEDLKGRRQPEALREIALEFENIRAGWQHQPWHTGSETLMNMVKSFWYFADLGNRAHEAITLLEQTLAYPGLVSSEPPVVELRELVRACYGWFHAGEGRPLEGVALAQQAVNWLETPLHPENLVVGLIGLSVCLHFSSQFDTLISVSKRCLALSEQYGNTWGKVHGLLDYTSAIIHSGRWEEAYELAVRSLPLFRSVNDRFVMGLIHVYMLGRYEIDRENYDAARQYIEQGLHYFEEIGQFAGMGRGFQSLAILCAAQQNYPDAVRYHRQSLRLLARTGQIQGVLEAMYEVAHLMQMMERHDHAVELYSLLTRYPQIISPNLQTFEEQRAALKTQVSPEAYTAAVERGKRLTLDEAVTRLIETEDW